MMEEAQEMERSWTINRKKLDRYRENWDLIEIAKKREEREVETPKFYIYK